MRGERGSHDRYAHMKLIHYQNQSALNKPVLAVTATLSAAIAGYAIAVNPLIAMGIFLAASSLILVTLDTRLGRLFLVLTSVLLAGYAFFGRAFAYLGIPPLYVGELVLALGLLAFVWAPRRKRLAMPILLLIVFVALGALRTIPFLGVHGIDAVRDAALWYYALYAVLIYLMLQPEHLTVAVRWFGRLLPWLLVWFAATSLLYGVLRNVTVTLPGSPISIFSVKQGDRGVLLACAAAFLLLGLYNSNQSRMWFPTSLLWGAWCIAFLVVAAINRGGLLSVTLALLLVFLLSPSRHWLKPALLVCSAGLVLLVWDPQINIGTARSLSVSQLASNVASIFSSEESGQGALQGTRSWRLNWWGEIWNYTVRGEHFWGGKGFGINLATEDGFQVLANESLRAPHSSHMSVLARMGVPGLMLWLSIQLGFAISLGRSIFRSRAQDQDEQARIKTWLLATWLAAMVNSSFDVYLEGPQGAILFWSVFGAGLAAVRADSQPAESPNGKHASLEQGAVGASPARS